MTQERKVRKSEGRKGRKVKSEGRKVSKLYSCGRSYGESKELSCHVTNHRIVVELQKLFNQTRR